MAVMIAVLMSFSNLTVNAQEKVKLNAASKEKTLEVTLELPVTEKGIDAEPSPAVGVDTDIVGTPTRSAAVKSCAPLA